MDSLIRLGDIEFILFQIKKKGWLGYLSHLISLKRAIRQFNPNLIHAHYGLSGLLANLQRRIPVISTFHGSDVNDPGILKWSKWTHKLSAASIFVEKNMMKNFEKHHNSSNIPCGVDLSIFYTLKKIEARNVLKIQQNSINILFSSDFNNPVKNFPLARESCNIVEKKIGRKVNLLELKGLSRHEVNLYMNACDAALLFSTYEGSPQFIKEAMACNCPIVATNVGDIEWIIGETEGCYITAPEVEALADKIISALKFSEIFDRTNGRERILNLGLDTDSIAKKVLEVYGTTYRLMLLKG